MKLKLPIELAPQTEQMYEWREEGREKSGRPGNVD